MRVTRWRVKGAMVAVALLASGCSSMQMARNADMDAALVSGDYRAAALLAESRLGLKPAADGALPDIALAKGSVLNHLEAGEAWRMAGERERALAHFDRAEAALQAVETQALASSGAKQIGATLINDGLLDYTPSPAEAVLMNYYKAITFWAAGDRDNARVELNRAEDRVRRAVERYEKEIAAAEAESKGKQGADRKNVDAVAAKIPEMAQWQPYDGFVMPQATYLHALFLASTGDRADRDAALALLERVRGLEPDNQVVARDIENLTKRGALCPAGDCVWIVTEEGAGPVLQELRTDLPVPTATGFVMVSLALPKLVSRRSDAADYVVASTPAGPVPEFRLSDMDRVVQSEFSKRFPATVTRALVGATARAIAQEQLNKNVGPWGALAGMVANIALTGADLRSWRSTPALTRVAQIRAGEQPLVLTTASGPQTVELPESGMHIVYVKQSIATAPALVQILPLSNLTATASAR